MKTFIEEKRQFECPDFEFRPVKCTLRATQNFMNFSMLIPYSTFTTLHDDRYVFLIRGHIKDTEKNISLQ